MSKQYVKGGWEGIHIPSYSIMIRNKTIQESNVQKRIGNLCKNWRKENKITLSQIAELNNVCISTIHAFEKGESDSYIYLLTYILMGLSTYSLIEIWSDYYGRAK